MENKGSSISLIVGIITFLILILLGLTSGVTFTVALYRAFGGALVIGLLIYGLFYYLKNYLLPDFKQEEQSQAAELNEAASGGQLDLMAGQDEDLMSMLRMPQESTDSTNNGQRENEVTEEFIPFAPQQIDPNLQRIINDNPEQAAEVLKRMGLEE